MVLPTESLIKKSQSSANIKSRDSLNKNLFEISFLKKTQFTCNEQLLKIEKGRFNGKTFALNFD